ncbi:MAG: hypothetical protein M3R68_03020 [Acidobacteriota bacterium]|nr:hypothetical protein [Acidobacteriota bacterium]
MSTVKNFKDLSTSYVNLAALVRHLREQQFAGTIHVIVDQYEAEVRLNAEGEPTVAEIDRANGRASENEGAMERLLVHAREPDGKITVYASEDAEDNSGAEGKPAPANREVKRKNEPGAASAFTSEFPTPAAAPAEGPAEVDWEDLLDAGGMVIGGVERAVVHVGGNFELIFRTACIKLGDDYPFLDPTTGGLTYAARTITLNDRPAANIFVTALVECLRRITNQLAIGKESKRFRETVAIELAVAARMRPTGLSQFTPQLNQIAGTRVL